MKANFAAKLVNSRRLGFEQGCTFPCEALKSVERRTQAFIFS